MLGMGRYGNRPGKPSQLMWGKAARRTVLGKMERVKSITHTGGLWARSGSWHILFGLDSIVLDLFLKLWNSCQPLKVWKIHVHSRATHSPHTLTTRCPMSFYKLGRPRDNWAHISASLGTRTLVLHGPPHLTARGRPWRATCVTSQITGWKQPQMQAIYVRYIF